MPWADKEHDAVVKAIAIVCELTGTQFSDAAKQVMVRQLGAYPCRAVLGALERCAAECKFKLTLADVIQRLDDGRPGAEEAWGAFPKSEQEAGCVTQEMSVAWGAAAPLFESDKIAARMAFKEVYEREVRSARARGDGVRWMVSPGFDRASTEAAAIEGLRKGLLTSAAALQYVLPENHDRALYAAGLGPKVLPPKAEVQAVKQLVAGIIEGMEKKPHWSETDE